MTFDSYLKSSFIRVKCNIKKRWILQVQKERKEETKKAYHFLVITIIFTSITGPSHNNLTCVNPFSLPFLLPKMA